jgi:hypothetical protein
MRKNPLRKIVLMIAELPALGAIIEDVAAFLTPRAAAARSVTERLNQLL